MTRDGLHHGIDPRKWAWAFANADALKAVVARVKKKKKLYTGSSINATHPLDKVGQHGPGVAHSRSMLLYFIIVYQWFAFKLVLQYPWVHG
jgi:hypothetical protein